MRKTYIVDFCLEDFKNGQQAIESVFDLIAKVKAVVFAQAGKVFDYSFSNIPDKEHNPQGNIGTLAFDIGTQDDWDRELKVVHFMTTNYGYPIPTMMVSFGRSANTKVPLSNLDPGVGESQAVRV